MEGSSAMRLGEISWTQAKTAFDQGASAIIPLGSIEEHGPHVPMGDYVVIDEIARRAAEASGDLVVPTMPFGYSEYFRHYPGTITLRPETLTNVVDDTIGCLIQHGARRIVIFNGHAGNSPILELLARRVRRRIGLLIPIVSPLQVIQNPTLIARVYGEGVQLGHGGEPMGSIMMALRPGSVHMERAADFGRRPVLGLPTDGLGAIVFRQARVFLPLDMQDITPESGSLSDPSLATPERGRALLDFAVEYCAEFMRWFRTADPWQEADTEIAPQGR
jgi:creatinine amidohydrolase